MMLLPLFDDEEVLNEYGKTYAERIKKALRPILLDAINSDIRLRDFAWVVAHTLELEIAFAITQRRFNKKT